MLHNYNTLILCIQFIIELLNHSLLTNKNICVNVYYTLYIIRIILGIFYSNCIVVKKHVTIILYYIVII